MCNWLNIRTGYSFKSVFGHVDEIMAYLKKHGCTAAGIADISSTFGHVRWKKACQGAGIKSIYGVRLAVSDYIPDGSRSPRYDNTQMTFIAKNEGGLHELYHLVDLAHQQFYHIAKITYKQFNCISNDVAIISGLAPDKDKIGRGLYLQASPDLPRAIKTLGIYRPIACIDNWYPRAKDKASYEAFSGYVNNNFEEKTSPMHILTDDEWKELLQDDFPEAIQCRNHLAEDIPQVELPKAPFISIGKNAAELLTEKCKAACRSQPDLHSSKIKKRLKKELDLIISKNFSDYFLVVADLVAFAKTKMVVGPARGSSAGSLVCYLLGITTINPLKYDLLFERFIDTNRTDLPDIDIDFQDDKRNLVIKYLQKEYGSDNIAQIGNVSRLKPKSAINRVCKSLGIPPWEVSEFKDGIEERPEGNARERYAITDALKDGLGKTMKRAWPGLKQAARVEGHPAHSSVHAAGVLVCTQPISNFCGINSREKNRRVAMIDKRDAEELNLLKIDALGLITLSTLAEVCDLIKEPYSFLEGIPLDDKETFKSLKKPRNLVGIFQMEGAALGQLVKQGMKAKNIDDLAALSALCRPGPLMSGAASKYVSQHDGKLDTVYMSRNKAIRKWTEPTLGNIIYQEQIMGICREYGGMSWPDVIKVRKLMGKSMGDEAFSAYKKTFIKGAKKQDDTSKTEAKEIWDLMKNFGQYGFNKSHAVAYAIITYWTAYMKTHHLKEFTVAMLNHTSNTQNGIRVLRSVCEKQGVQYKAYHEKHSQKNWSIKNGKLYGGLLDIEGIGPANANTIIKSRREGLQLPPGIFNALHPAKTPYEHLYPAQEIYGKYYKGKKQNRAVPISEIKENNTDYIFIGVLTLKKLKNLNAPDAVIRRGYKEEGTLNYWTLEFEDDSGSIYASISREYYDDYGSIINEDSRVGKDWYLIMGNYAGNKFHRVFVKTIKKITRD